MIRRTHLFTLWFPARSTPYVELLRNQADSMLRPVGHVPVYDVEIRSTEMVGELSRCAGRVTSQPLR
jgi:hypothetical protein